MSGPYTESGLVERPALDLLEELGWTVVNAFAETFGRQGTLGRDSMHDAILSHRLSDAIDRLNPTVPGFIRDEALKAVARDRAVMDPVRANREVYELVRNGYRAEWQGDHGQREYATVQFIDFRDPTANDLLAASQVWMAGDLYRRRVDTLLFINGIPLVLLEFKEPNRYVKAAYDENLTDYRDTVPQLFVPNGFVILSNGSDAKVGSTYASWEFFADWKVVDNEGHRGLVALETAIRGTCAPKNLLDLIENFVAFIQRPGRLVKAVARNHQMLGVNAAIEHLYRVRAVGEKRLGVFWHTQGSGKSLSMLWFTQKVLHQIPGAWTFVMVTDRTELDVQLHGEFADAGAISREARVHATSITHLRELLAADHRYVFTLIQKFRPSPGENQMPILSDRSDVIVITDEAHRTQYDTLALNMRQALPNASLMGFTGTPLIAGEELTRQQFGEYVSVYNFRDAIADGATVPLFYENRSPELHLMNEDFEEELAALLEQAELDEVAEGEVARRFSQQYTLLTRPERQRQIAKDIVTHFVGRGFVGKAMYVGLDKAAAVRMFNYVRDAWAEHLTELRIQHDGLPEIERPWLASRIALMESTDMAVVVSQGQNEISDLDRLDLDIRPHRERMNREDLATKFKSPEDPLRLVFVCAMWITGFDAPSVSTIYLDRPMRNHTLMQTIARANRVFPDKDNGLIVDYVNVFQNLEKALAIYGSSDAASVVDSPIQDIEELAAELESAIQLVISLCKDHSVDILALRDAKGFSHIALRDSAVEVLLAEEETRTTFLAAARRVKKLFKALLPDPRAAVHQNTVAAIRTLGKRIADVSRPEPSDIEAVVDAVDQLLDRSIGAEEYIIRAAAEGAEPDPLIDLSQIDFDALAAAFAGRKRAETDRLAAVLKQRAAIAATRNPTRYDMVERIEAIIADYNAGSLNINEYLRRLVELSKSLSTEEQRAVAEDLSEEELAIFDLLTKPDPALTDAEREKVKSVAKRLLSHLHAKLVLDWRRRAATMADVRVAILDVLDQDLPEDPYPQPVFEAKVQAVFDHVLTAYGDNQTSVYGSMPVDERTETSRGLDALKDQDLGSITDAVVERIRTDAEFASLVANQLGLPGGAAIRTVDEIINHDEDYSVEFKSTARWDLREGKPNKVMEDAVVKTVAGFLNTDGGTLLIGVDDSGNPIGLGYDYERVKPKNGDGFVNWLTTHLINSLGYTPVARIRARITTYRNMEICRVDVAKHTEPVWAKTSKDVKMFFARFNNSTRALPEDEVSSYVASHGWE